MSSLETNGSPQLELARSFFLGIEKRDINQVEKTLHKDHRRLTHPRSVGKPEQTKEEYLKHNGEVLSLLTEDCKLTFHSVIEAPGKVVLHVTGRASTSIGVEAIREMMWIGDIVTDEDGSLKIKQVEEFADSKSYLEFFKAAAEAKAKREHSSYAA